MRTVTKKKQPKTLNLSPFGSFLSHSLSSRPVILGGTNLSILHHFFKKQNRLSHTQGNTFWFQWPLASHSGEANGSSVPHVRASPEMWGYLSLSEKELFSTELSSWPGPAVHLVSNSYLWPDHNSEIPLYKWCWEEVWTTESQETG